MQCDCRELCAATRRQAAAFTIWYKHRQQMIWHPLSWQPVISLSSLMPALLDCNDGGSTSHVKPCMFFNMCIVFGRRALLVLTVPNSVCTALNDIGIARWCLGIVLWESHIDVILLLIIESKPAECSTFNAFI